MNLLRVDVGKRETTMQAIPPQYEGLGGRGLGAKILLEEVDPTCHALGHKNKIIFAIGLWPTSRLSSSGRLSVVSKSPLTGTIKEANAGGTVGQKLGRLGIRAIIVEGAPQDNHSYLLKISKGVAQLEVADDLKMKGNYALAKELIGRYGDKASIIAIGPAGENGLFVSSVVCTDADGDPSRVAARGGLGAVMASKGLKAIVVVDDGDHSIKIHDEKAFREATKLYHQALLANPLLGKIMPTMGTPGSLMILNDVGGLPTRNFREGSFEHAEAISGPSLQKLVHSRGGAGRFGMTCMPGCVIRCTHAFADAQGNEVVRALEYETLGMM
ncbi:MAG: aldehyde ferredoxin oxidoreductase N-terminal domain-containing protein, partial [Dehalococcoidia bacterium]|nr:aldehyde ferredoxin oxidoreductase N-terminal domain-containing protein [Dehalococcoidia bacterium]